MKRIITLTISILLLFSSLSACGQNVATTHSKYENIPEVNWYYEFFSDKDDTVAITNNQTKLLNKGMVSVDQSVSSNGYTITLESVISDGYRSFFKFRVTAPTGSILDGDRYIFDCSSQITGKNGEDLNLTFNAAGDETLEDNNITDNEITMLYESTTAPTEESAGIMKHGTVWTISISKISEYLIVDDGAEKHRELRKEIPGEWVFSITFDESTLLSDEYECLSTPVRCPAKRYMREHSFPVTVQFTSFKIRAFGGTLCYDKPLTGFWEGIELEPIFVHLKDGTVVEAHFRTGQNKTDHWESVFEFPIPMAVEDIDYIEFPGSQKIFISTEHS